MNGTCDTCGEPAVATCAAPGCDNEMCAEHATYTSATTLDIAFCPEHAYMAREA